MLSLLPDTGVRALEILCVGAHCDDIEIGCGATLLVLQKHRPCRIHWAIISSTPPRRREAERAQRAFVQPKSRGALSVGDVPDAHLPSYLRETKAFLLDVRTAVQPDLIFTTRLEDRHQDHRVTNEVTWQTFRDHLIFEYEIPKYEGDLLPPNVYVPVSGPIAKRKSALLLRLYASQRDKYWFNESTFEALMRIRGIECRADSGFAEAFHCRKLVVGGAAISNRRKGRT